MAEFTRNIASGASISGTFRATVQAGDEIAISVDSAGTLSCEKCGIALSANANETDEESGEITGSASDSGVATASGTFSFNYTGFNATGPGHFTASGFQSVIEPLSVSPSVLKFDASGGVSGQITIGGSFESYSASISSSWISHVEIADISGGISISENTSIKRSGYVTITAQMQDGTTESCAISVQQEGASLSVSPTEWHCGNGGGGRTISISPAGLRVVAIPQTDWLSFSGGMVRASANTGAERTGTVYLSIGAPDSNYYENRTITVVQEAGTGSGGSGTGGESGSGSGGSGTGGESGSGSGEESGQGETKPSGTLSDGSGRVGTVIFKNQYGATLHYIVKQTN